jgi:cyclic nucleotide gated channel
MLLLYIKVFLHAVMAKKRKMQLRCRDMEWWMRRRQLPSRLRQRVRHFERQRWAIMGGEDEMEMIKDLPEGLRRDIKRYLCLDLIKKVKDITHYHLAVCFGTYSITMTKKLITLCLF